VSSPWSETIKFLLVGTSLPILLHKSHIYIYIYIYISSMSLSNALPADAARAAKSASHRLATLSASSRNDALTTIHSALIGAKDEILAANARDLVAAKQAATKGELSTSLVSRLDLGKKGKWEDMLKGILDVRGLEDPGKPLLCHALYTPWTTYAWLALC